MNQTPIQVLAIEDNPADAALLEVALAECKSQIYAFRNIPLLAKLSEALKEKPADIILLDLSLPDGEGIESIQKTIREAPDIPIVVFTGTDDDTLGLETIHAGAQDYIAKGAADSRTLSRAIRYAIERKKAERLIARMAHYDHLTQLPNRSLFYDRLNHLIAQSRRHDQGFALFFLDLDQFKSINDSLGHAAGDELLVQVASRLSAAVRTPDTVARLGGDEFALLLPEISEPDDARVVVEKILEHFQKPFALSGHQQMVTASIGISLSPADGRNSAALMKNADLAMYRAKQTGKNKYEFFSTDDRNLRPPSMATALREGLDRNEFRLYFQPRLDLVTKKIVGVEALIRWKPARGGIVSPDQFIPVAEATGLIHPIGKWVLREACRQGKAWKIAGLGPLSIAVNVSAYQLNQTEFFESFLAILKEKDFDPESLEIEITESQLISNPTRIASTFRQLRALGIRISIDDFGTGYSSLGYLSRFAIDTVKIDQGFIRRIPQQINDMEIVRAILDMAGMMGLHVVAEGVETKEQLQFLEEHHCPEAQGFLICRPMRADRFPSFFKKINEHSASVTRLRGTISGQSPPPSPA